MPLKTAHRWLAILLLLHISLAIGFAWTTPYRTGGRLVYQGGAFAADIGAPDERQHVNYVTRLLRGEGLPVLDPSDPDLYENYQAHQPPLYYGIAAAWSTLAGFQPDSTENSNGFRLRLLNVLIGSGTVLGVFALALWALRRPESAVFAAAIAALLPMHLALNGAVSNDPLLFCLCTWSLAFMAKASNEGWCLGLALKVGLLVGLAMLAKTTAVALLPALLVCGIASRKKGTGALRFSAIAGLVALAIPLLWWARNVQVYGDPLAMRAFEQSFTGSAQAALFMEALGARAYWVEWVGWWTARSFIGAFGYMDIFLPSPVYAAALLVLLGLWVVGGLSIGKLFPDEKWALLPLWTFLAVVTLLFARFNLQYFQGQARYLFPAIGPLAVLSSIGAARMAPNQGARPTIAIAAALLAIDLFALWILPSEFARRVGTPSVRMQAGTSVSQPFV